MENQALTYWFFEDDLVRRLKKMGFEILEIKKSQDFLRGKDEGMLYIVCKK